MGRFLALIAVALTLGLCLGASPAHALDPTEGVGKGTSPGDWFDKQKGQHPNWDVTGKVSPGMAQILSQALVDFGSYQPENVCKGAAAGQAWQALADAANAGPIEGFLDAIKGALGGIKDVALFGADPSAAADLLDAKALTEKAFDQAKDMGGDWLKQKLKDIWNGKKIEVLSRTQKRGACETMLVAIWDEGAGTYEIVIYGDCHCAAVGGWSIGSTGTALHTFAVTINGSVTPSISQGKGVFVIGFPKIKVFANCGCGAKSSSVTGGGTTGGAGGVTPGGGQQPPPTNGAGWAKVTTKCKECQPIVDQIHAAQDARDQMDKEFRQAQFNLDTAKRDLELAKDASERAAAQAEVDAAIAAMNALTGREAGLIKLQNELWAKLKGCEAACGHASTGACPPRGGEYALAGQTAGGAVASTSAQAGMAAQVLAEINAARADPHAYADRLRRYAAYYHGNLVSEPGHPVAMTIEGAAAVQDAIAYLDRRPPAPPLSPSEGLAFTAARLVADLGPKGGLGHTGSDGSTMTSRMRDQCVWAAAMEENIALTPRTAEGVVRQLVIDDGVPTRGHRTALFDPGLSIAGAACGPHARYGWMCVVDFAGALVAAPGSESGMAVSP